MLMHARALHVPYSKFSRAEVTNYLSFAFCRERTVFFSLDKDKQTNFSMHLQFLLWYSKMSGVSNTTGSHLHTCIASLVFWPSLYACAQRYHMGRSEATMASYFGLVRPQQASPTLAQANFCKLLSATAIHNKCGSMSGDSTALLSFLPTF